MKKDDIKKDIKIVRKAKPSAKGVALKSVKKENPKRGATTPPPPQPLLTKEGKGVVNGRSRGVFRRGKARVFNFKRWHKLSAAIASIAIIGVVVFFQFAPENATRGTFESFVL